MPKKKEGVRKSKIGALIRKHEEDVLQKRFAKFYSDLQNLKFSLHDHFELAALFHELNRLHNREYDLERIKTGKVALDQHDLSTHLVPKLVVREMVLYGLHPDHSKFVRGFIHCTEAEYCMELTGKRKPEHEDPELHTKAHKKLHDIMMNDIKMYHSFRRHLDAKRKAEVERFIWVYGKEELAKLAQDLGKSIHKHRLLDEQLTHHHSSALASDVHNHIESNLDHLNEEILQCFREHL